MSGWRCLFWVQGLLGTGHLRRALAIAHALANRGAQVTLVHGGRPAPWTVPRGVELVQLPPIGARGTSFGELVDVEGAPVTASLWAARGRMLHRLLADQRPQALVTEMFPFGRRGFRGELLPLLAAARASPQPPVTAASVRDVLVSKADAGRLAWMAEAATAWYDRVLVHGDERLLPFAASFPLAERIADRLTHTGFVEQALLPAAEGDRPAVLVSTGGGAVGADLLRVAAAARPRSRLSAEPWLLVAGPNLDEGAFAALARGQPTGSRLVRQRADLPALMARFRVSVSQAGYNTVVEGLRAGARMVLVPFAEGGEDEQTRRAGRLAELGLAEVVPAATLTAGGLAAAIDRASLRSRPEPGRWSFDGAERTAAILSALVDARYRS